MIHLEAVHAELIDRLVTRTVASIEHEYPNSIRLHLYGPPVGVVTPRSIHPAFFGCFDWHSSVHSHWQVVRALRMRPGRPFVTTATAALDRTLTPSNIAAEMRWVAERPSFEMPYGMAWLLMLCRELRSWDDDRARRWGSALAPMESHAIERFGEYCSTLTVPVRGGLHDQTAFSLGLVWDAVPALRPLIGEAAGRFFGADTAIDVRHEPSATDFLSPALGEADLMRRVLPRAEFAAWFRAFAPHGFVGLRPVEVVDPSDGRLAHWAGLDLSRAWMLRAIADALPDDDPMVAGLRTAAAAHSVTGVATADHDEYMISHWVPTFAVYLLAGSAVA